MIDEIRQYVLELVQAEFETGHILSDDYNSFKKLVADDGYRATKKMYEFYLECRDLGPAGFLDRYKDELDFDSMFILEYGEEEELEDEEEEIEESLTEKTNMEKLRSMYPELSESYDEQGNAERCEECNTLLNDSGECPKCVHGEEDIEEALTEASAEDKIQKNREKADAKEAKLYDKLRVHADKVIQNDKAHKDAKTWTFYVLDPHGKVKNKYTQVEFMSKFANDDKTRYNALVVDAGGHIVRRGTEWLYKKGYKFYPNDLRSNMPLEKYTYESAHNLPPFFKYPDNISRTSTIAASSKKKSDGMKQGGVDNMKDAPQPTPPTPVTLSDEDPSNSNGRRTPGNNNGGTPSNNGGNTGNNNSNTNSNNITISNNTKNTGNNKTEGNSSAGDKAKVNDVADVNQFFKIAALLNPKVEFLNPGTGKLENSNWKSINKDNLDAYYVTINNKEYKLDDLIAGAKKNGILRESLDRVDLYTFFESLSLDDDIEIKECNEMSDLDEGLSTADLHQVLDLAGSIGIETIGDMDRFAKENAQPGESVLDTLRRYRDDLGPDFELKEDTDLSPETDTEDDCEIIEDSFECFNI